MGWGGRHTHAHSLTHSHKMLIDTSSQTITEASHANVTGKKKTKKNRLLFLDRYTNTGLR